jgi:peptide/nickel transport system substrate-binding protein
MLGTRIERAWIALAVFGLVAAIGCQGRGDDLARPHRDDGPVFGGSLVVGIRSEPQTWNRLLATDQVSHEITELIHGALVRVNRVTQEIEPRLAESWSFSEDGKTLTFKLRPDARFSDGEPFTAEDVAFTFRALHDPEVASPLVETAMVDGEPLVPEVVDPLTIRFALPTRTAVVERLFDSLYILPRHRLEASLDNGSFASEYGIGASGESIVGLGPFLLEGYLPGQRVILRRNPHFWEQSEDGRRLPYLDSIVFEIAPDANALMLRFREGKLDLLQPVSPEDFLALEKSGRSNLRLLDIGPGSAPERLWFNLNPESSFVSPDKKAWFGDTRFRRAVSLAIDRNAITQVVYLDLASTASGPVSPANHEWWNESVEPTPFDRERAKGLLREAGFDWDGAGTLVDGQGRPVSFTLVTNADNPHRVKTGALIQEDLAQIGIEMSLVPLDFASLIGRITQSFDYEACLLSILMTDPDPSAEMPLWLSRSPLHIWHPSQSQPSTAWEARIDSLMERQMAAVEESRRKALFDKVQEIVLEELPVVDLVIPHALVGARRRVGNLKPTPFWHPLWNREGLYIAE